MSIVHCERSVPKAAGVHGKVTSRDVKVWYMQRPRFEIAVDSEQLQRRWECQCYGKVVDLSLSAAVRMFQSVRYSSNDEILTSPEPLHGDISPRSVNPRTFEDVFQIFDIGRLTIQWYGVGA